MKLAFLMFMLSFAAFAQEKVVQVNGSTEGTIMNVSLDSDNMSIRIGDEDMNPWTDPDHFILEFNDITDMLIAYDLILLSDDVTINMKKVGEYDETGNPLMNFFGIFYGANYTLETRKSNVDDVEIKFNGRLFYTESIKEENVRVIVNTSRGNDFEEVEVVEIPVRIINKYKASSK
jgi:sporulation protein YlmC with PRC-barrel domain